MTGRRVNVLGERWMHHVLSLNVNDSEDGWAGALLVHTVDEMIEKVNPTDKPQGWRIT